MAIVKMKRLHIIGFAEDREALTASLQHLGCVEISEPLEKLNDPEWSSLLRRSGSELAGARAANEQLESALKALDKYAPEKGGLFRKRSSVSEQDFFKKETLDGALGIAGKINGCVEAIAGCYAEENKLKTQILGLEPWKDLDMPLETEETASAEFILASVPLSTQEEALKNAAAEITDLFELTKISEDRNQKCYLLICHKTVKEELINGLRAHSFSVAHFRGMQGTAKENIDRLNKALSETEAKRKREAESIAAFREARPELMLCLDRTEQEIGREAVSERLLTDGTVIFLEGWVPEENTAELTESLKKLTCAVDLADPAEGETPPTKLKNPKWMESINMVTEMYSLPAYGGIDPNPLMFFWYVLFFGIMFADVAYGIIIFLVSYLIIKKYDPKKTMGRMFHLGMWLGGSTAFCGIFVGGFFGNALDVIYQNFLPGVEMPGWMQAFSKGIIVNPVTDPMKVLILAVLIGCVQLVMGQCIHIYMCARDGELMEGILDVVPWWIVFAGIGYAAAGGPAAGIGIGFLALLLTQGRHAKGIFGKLAGGLKSWYDITSWLSDVLSYARLMALMLATSVIAMVFNTIGALPKNVVAFAVVFVIGHGFNIGVNLIGTYVHAARLQYLEYFGKFYRDGGVPFRPLQYDTKYVDVIKEKEN